jgi:hypothetical protein
VIDGSRASGVSRTCGSSRRIAVDDEKVARAGGDPDGAGASRHQGRSGLDHGVSRCSRRVKCGRGRLSRGRRGKTNQPRSARSSAQSISLGVRVRRLIAGRPARDAPQSSYHGARAVPRAAAVWNVFEMRRNWRRSPGVSAVVSRAFRSGSCAAVCSVSCGKITERLTQPAGACRTRHR